jgi:biopolymer transport protein ExbD
MMQRLDIEFCESRRSSAWLGRLLVAIAAVVALDAGLSYHAAGKALREGQVRLAKRAPAGAAPKVSAQEVAAVRETVQRIALPWDELFIALESASSDRVALASIEPDPKKGTVTISGDGKDYLAALSYVLNLSKTEGLEKVQLVRHEQKANDPNGAVNFSVSAAWSAK